MVTITAKIFPLIMFRFRTQPNFRLIDRDEMS